MFGESAMTQVTVLTQDPCYTNIVFVKNVTVTLDEETATWARLEAARRDISVSSLLRDLLREAMGGQEAYASARARYRSRGPYEASSGAPYPSREELHDRAGLR
jgi:hypothetical protein